MSEWRSRYEVALWEFQRFVKPNQIVFTFVLTLLLGLMGWGTAKWAQRSDSKVNNVVVIGGDRLGLNTAQRVGNIALTPGSPAQLDSLRQAVTARTLDGILIVNGADSARLIVRRDPTWKSALAANLSAARQRLELEKAGLTSERLSAMLAPMPFATEYQSGSDSRGARIAALIAVGLVLYGVFTSMAYMMVSVTAEKQLRVTEQVISAIPAQTWIDGKILGIAAVAFVNVGIFLAGTAVWILGRSIATGASFSIGSVEPLALTWIAVFAVLGFIFWLAVFGAIAATIDDPNTSTRGPLMFVPALFSVAGFLSVRNPDSMFARVTGLIPLTSSSVMPARVALTDVPVWELVVSAALLVVGALLARRAAGRVFSVAMLMYGKEASWGEIRRWAREG